MEISENIPASDTATVLLVEPISLVSHKLAEHLRDSGAQIVEASTAEQAIDLIDDNPGIRVVFAEMDLPGPINGAGLAYLIKNHWPHISCVWCSDSPLSRPMARDVVRKPYDYREVARTLTDLLCQPHTFQASYKAIQKSSN